MSRMAFVFLLLAAICLPLSMLAQSSSASSKSKVTPGSAQAPFRMKAYSRMVTLDVVVENRKGHHIRGLKASDFQIYEQTPIESNKKRLQTIAHLREVHTAALKPPVEAPANAVPGVYSNVIRVQKDPVPPTVLLVDGINTPFRFQAAVHEQMLKMLRQLPANVPVAVLLMGSRLRLLQSFTTDHALVLKALGKAESVTGQGLGQNDSTGSLLGSLAGGAGSADLAGNIAAAQSFDQMVSAGNLRERIERTFDAFYAIARTLEGYPGRKNVLWLSTSFPLTLHRFMNQGGPTLAPSNLSEVNDWKQMRVLDNALSRAKVAVYPVDIGGVRFLQGSAALQQFEGQNTMIEMAKATGGKVCMGNNDLARCVEKAVHDSSDFYEISYYPNSGHWNGEYRRIIVHVDKHDARLSYRRGYYATPEVSADTKSQAAEMRKDCGDLLNATGIAFTAKTVPSKRPRRLTFRLLINPSDLTFTPDSNEEQTVKVVVGVCTYNRRGWSQKLMAYPLNLSLKAGDYSALMAGGHVVDAIYVPGPKPSGIRLLVKDVPSGKLGSVYIKTAKSR